MIEPKKLKRSLKPPEKGALDFQVADEYIDKTFHRLELLGEGTYGVVYKARHIPSGRIVALKKLRWENTEDGIPATSVREISLLKELSHPTIVNLLSVHLEPAQDKRPLPRLFLEFEFLDLDLRKYSKGFPDRRIPMPTVKDVIYQIMVGTAYCHTHRTMHRDLKPCNILLSVLPKRVRSLRNASAGRSPVSGTSSEHEIGSDNADENPEDFVEVKLADFGLARTFAIPLKPLTHEVVTLWYRAPEILLGMDRYSTAVDIFSIGVILLELLHGRPPFAGDCEVETLFKMFELLGTPTQRDWAVLPQLPHYQEAWPLFECRPDRFDYLRQGVDVECKDLLDRLLKFDPAKRITAKKALEHPWFDSVDKSAFSSLEG